MKSLPLPNAIGRDDGERVETVEHFLGRQRESELQQLIAAIFPIITLQVIFGMIISVTRGNTLFLVMNVIGWVLMYLVLRATRLPFSLRTSLLLGTPTFVGFALLLLNSGFMGVLWFTLVPIAAVLLCGFRIALIFLVALTLTLWLAGSALQLSYAPPAVLADANLLWTVVAGYFLGLTAMKLVVLSKLVQRQRKLLAENFESESRLARLSETDQLTGLPNRRKLRTVLQDAMQRHLGAAVLFVDLDHFKAINDRYGHAAGDQVLLDVAQRLSTLVQAPSRVGRPGSDEFVIVYIPDGAADGDVPRQALEQLCHAVRRVMAAPFTVADGGEHPVRISIGISLLHGDHSEPDDALREADLAMSRAKALGRNTTVLFEPNMAQELVDRLQLAQDLEDAVATGKGLSVAVHSQVDASGEVCGAEVLARWMHPTRGEVAPADFIPLAEQTGLIVPLGDWVLEQVCALARELQVRQHSLPLSVNISPRQFAAPEFARKLKETVARFNAPASALTLEITEALLITGPSERIGELERLVEAGFRFSIDDFGTGYSSLSYLKRLPISEIKIDRSFVAGLPHESDDVSLVKAIVLLARELGLKVVAEGVETVRQAQFLTAQGCQTLQGFLFAEPLAPEQWLATLKPAAPPVSPDHS